MKLYPQVVLGALLAAELGRAVAATPPADQLLPPDTLGVLTVPDCQKWCEAGKQSPMQLLWDDPALKPFREKLLNKLKTDVLDKIEQELGIKLAEYADLPQGQFTLAITRNGWSGTVDPLPALLLIIDARDKGELLKAKLEQLRQKLTDSGKTLKTEKVRDLDITVLPLNPEGKPDAPAVNLAFGQAGSVLVASLSLRDIDRVVGRLQGASLPHLAEETTFDADAKAFFRDAQSFGWINFQPLAEVIFKIAAALPANEQGPKPDMILTALGLKSLKTLALGNRATADGVYVDMNLRSPGAERKGVLKLLATEVKDAGMPAYVPADAVGFWRWRLSGQKVWGTIEATVEEIAPGMLNFFLAQLDAGLKQKNPDLDFKRSFIMNLGDDLIGWQKAPKSTAPADLLSQPSLSLIGSPNADQLLGALRGAAALVPLPGGLDFKEREFLGRKIHTLTLPDFAGTGKANEVHLAASGGYLAIAQDTAILEEYLRSSDTKPKPLAEFPGLKEAADKVGGMSTGLFGFQNDAELLKPFWEALRSNKNLFFELVTAQNPALKGAMGEQEEIQKKIAEWADFSLLPAFDQVAKYFHFSVYAGQASNAGYLLKTYMPTPPRMK